MTIGNRREHDLKKDYELQCSVLGLQVGDKANITWLDPNDKVISESGDRSVYMKNSDVVNHRATPSKLGKLGHGLILTSLVQGAHEVG